MHGITAVLALTAIAAASAADCRSDAPKAWISNIVAFDPNHREYHNHTSDYYVHAHFFYDEELQAKRSIENGVVGDDNRELFDIIELFNTKKAYVVNIREKSCKTFDINYPFVPATPPSFSNFTGISTIGTAGVDGLDLNQYEAHDQEKGLALYQTYTSKDCLPVRNDHFSEDTGFHYEQHSDISLKVDRSVFDVPSVCSN